MITRRSVFVRLSVSILTCAFAVGGAIAGELSPKETYLKYRPALEKAKKIEDVSSFMCKRVNAQIASTPAGDRPMMFEMMKDFQPGEVTIVSEDLKGDHATLSMTTSKVDKNVTEKGTGTCTFVKEDGAWKIDKESWNSKIESK